MRAASLVYKKNIRILLPARTQTHLTDENQNIEKTAEEEGGGEEVLNIFSTMERVPESQNLCTRAHGEAHSSGKLKMQWQKRTKR